MGRAPGSTIREGSACAGSGTHPPTGACLSWAGTCRGGGRRAQLGVAVLDGLIARLRPPYRPRMTRRAMALSALYYGALLTLQVLAITGRLGDVLPPWVATHVGKDSEAILLALVLPAWVQFARPRLRGHRREWGVTALAVAVLVVLGVWMYATPPIPGNVETLNESLFACAALIPYVQLKRPVSRLLAIGIPVVLLVLILAASGTALVTNLAELLAMLILVPLGLDVVDRAILEPQVSTSSKVRWSWYALLLAAPIFISVVLADAFPPGATADAVRYAIRVQEAWVGLLLLQIYFAVGHGRVGPAAPPWSQGSEGEAERRSGVVPGPALQPAARCRDAAHLVGPATCPPARR